MMKALAILTIACLASVLAQNNNNKQSNTNNDKVEGIPGPRPHDHPGSGRLFPGFNAEGTVLPPGPIPNYPDEGLPPFNPYASPQYGLYPSYQPIQPQHPQGFPIQPQILYYSGSGQPILINPGNPPGNFLVPQPIPQPAQPVDPNIFRNPGFPQNPVYVSGSYPPKQPVVPPIDKDAEQIPAIRPQEVIPDNGPKKQKPQKIELDDTEDESLKPARPAEAPPTQPKPSNIPPNRNFLNLRPGQRFFILNGQPLFSNYPHLGYQGPSFGPESFPQPYIVRPQNFYPQQHEQPSHHSIASDAQQFKQLGPLANIILRNQPQIVHQHLVPQNLKDQHFRQNTEGLPVTLHNQVVDKELQSVVLSQIAASTKDNLQSRYYEKTLPLEEHQSIFETPTANFDYYKYNDGADDATIIIDAKYQEPNEVDDDVETETEKPAESSVAEAQPGAIALAGDGGVAAAGPRGTALAGEGGLAVSSPHATAVAGPAKDDAPVDQEDKKKKPIAKSK